MADYGTNIDTYYYKYRQPIYITEITGQDQTFVALKLTLNSSNFNFNLPAFSNGQDFRVAENSNGSGVLQIWVAYWSKDRQRATVFVKLPYLQADSTKTLWAFWGNPAAADVSNLKYMLGELVGAETSTPVFIFGDAFNDGETSLDTTKWSSNGTVTLNGSYLTFNTDAYIEAKNTPLTGYRDWQYEDGFVKPAAGTNTTYYAHRINVLGGDNTIDLRYFNEDSKDRQHNFVDDETLVLYSETNKGIELDSYHNSNLRYNESNDRIYQGLLNRTTAPDYEDSWEREVLRNTWCTHFRIYGRDDSSSGGVNLLWVIIWEYDADTYPTIDLSELYVEYENVLPQQFDSTEYGDDLASVSFYHSTDAGGDPYRLSDNIVNSLSNVWESTTISGFAAIDFGRGNTDVTNRLYVHSDNNHVFYYPAARLSDDDINFQSKNYWQTTTSSGVWAAIKLTEAKAVVALSVWAVPTKLNGMIKNYKFYGSNKDPKYPIPDEDKFLLSSGVFEKTVDEQVVYFNPVGHRFYYYFLEAVDSYGDNVALQEWRMYEYTSNLGRRVVSQIRLRPVSFDSYDYYFPKRIEIYGSNDYRNWTQLLDIDTYTPFIDYYSYGRWQRYSFENDSAYYAYKIIFDDNWNAPENTLKVAEWELVEKTLEAYNYRILGGTSNNFNSVWADSGTTFDSGNIYAANDKLNVVIGNSLFTSTTISGAVEDINVVI